LTTLKHFNQVVGDPDTNIGHRIGSYHYALNTNGMRAGATEFISKTSGADEHAITYGYDALNRLETESVGSQYNVAYTYDLVGNRKKRTVTTLNGVLETTYTYDPDTDRLMTETHIGPIATVSWIDNQPVTLYAAADGGTYYRVPGHDGPVGSFRAWVFGLPSVWSRYILLALAMATLAAVTGPSLAAGCRRLRRMPTFERPRLSLCYRTLCVLLAWVFLVGPEGFQRAAYADSQYAQVSTFSWANGNQTIVYDYDDNGSLTSKTTTEGSTTVETVEYDYNLQNRLARVAITPYVNDQAQSPTLTEYRYNPQGIRVAKAEHIGGTTIQTDYLIDPYNHTGYAQVLEETEYDISGSTAIPINRIQYTLGDDVISQTQSITSDGGIDWTANPTQYLLYDGHGSTRQLVGTNQSIQQSYNYDGYGVLLQGASAESSPGITPPQETSLLYAGEQFDTNSQMYYNRARYYNPSNGLFNRVDPYAGNLHDPQSLHKYLYCHNNPVNGIDPSGKFNLIIAALAICIVIVAFLVLVDSDVTQFRHGLGNRLITNQDIIDEINSLKKATKAVEDVLKANTYNNDVEFWEQLAEKNVHQVGELGIGVVDRGKTLSPGRQEIIRYFEFNVIWMRDHPEALQHPSMITYHGQHKMYATDWWNVELKRTYIIIGCLEDEARNRKISGY
jgi:RHS repeat-associated protein